MEINDVNSFILRLLTFVLGSTLLVFGFACLFITSNSRPALAAAGDGGSSASQNVAPKPKSNYNTNIFVRESNNDQFTDTVKMISEVQNQTEVHFMKQPGTFLASEDGGAMERLIESKKLKLPVLINYNRDSMTILKVGKPEASSKDAAGAGSDAGGSRAAPPTKAGH